MTVTIHRVTIASAAQYAAAVVGLIRELAALNDESCSLSEVYVGVYLAGGGKILLAERQGQVMGLLSYSARPNLYHAGDSYLIEELVVGAGQRGQGVGRALVEALVREAEQAGYAEISVSTLLGNEQAIGFYRALGFGDEALLLERHSG